MKKSMEKSVGIGLVLGVLVAGLFSFLSMANKFCARVYHGTLLPSPSPLYQTTDKLERLSALTAFAFFWRRLATAK